MAEKRTLFQKLRLAVTIALGIVVLIVVFQNLESQNTRILIWDFAMPQAALLVVVLAVGYGLGTLRRRR